MTTVSKTNKQQQDDETNCISNCSNVRQSLTIAKGRWKLLRNAILTNATIQKMDPVQTNNYNNNNEQQYSIHQFEGYNLLVPSKTIHYHYYDDYYHNNDSTNNDTTKHEYHNQTQQYSNVNNNYDNNSFSDSFNLYNALHTIHITISGDDILLKQQHQIQQQQHIQHIQHIQNNIQIQIVNELVSSLLAIAALVTQENTSISNNTSFTDCFTVVIYNHDDDNSTSTCLEDDHDDECYYDNTMLQWMMTELQKQCSPEIIIHSVQQQQQQQQQKQQPTAVSSTNSNVRPLLLLVHVLQYHTTWEIVSCYNNKYTIQQYNYTGIKSTTEILPTTTTSSSSNYDLKWYTREIITKTNSTNNTSSTTTKNNNNTNNKISLQQLVSHQYNDNIDNTGNICVWDCSKTITYILLQYELGLVVSSSSSTLTNNIITNTIQQRQSTPKTILELGVGMAGLAGLASYTYFLSSYNNNNSKNNNNHNQYTTKIILTDGHKDCVRNNRINIRLCQASCNNGTRITGTSNSSTGITGTCNQTTTTTTVSATDIGEDDSSTNNRHYVQCTNNTDTVQIECQLLKWTIPDEYNSNNDDNNINSTKSKNNNINSTPLLDDAADMIIVADCIHFEEYHVALLWTIVHCLSVHGVCYLCQPNRGQSLERFLLLINHIHNNNIHNNNSINTDVVDKNHAEIQSDDNNNNNNTDSIPLVTITERFYDEIEQKHEMFQSIEDARKKQHLEHNNTCSYVPIYNSNIHKPRIIVLQKNRSITKYDHTLFCKQQQTTNKQQQQPQV